MMEPSRAIRLTAWLLLIAALLFSLGVRWRLLSFPLERDEGEYAYAGQLILHGVPPYQLAYNMKLPGTYLAYAVGMAVFGQTVEGVHLTLLAVNLAAIALVFFLTKDLFGPLAGGFAAMVYSLLALDPSMLGMAAHATHFIALFGTAGAWMLWKSFSAERNHWMFLTAGGLLFGIAFLMKQQGAFLMVFGGLAVLIDHFTRRPIRWKKLAADLPLYIGGAILPYALTCLWLWRAGVFGKFWHWTVEYAGQYVQQLPLSVGWLAFRQTFLEYIVPAGWPLWIAVAVGLVSVGLAKGDRRAKWFAYLFFVFAFACVCPGLFFRSHYFIAWLPAVAIFAGAACSHLIQLAMRRRAVQEPPSGGRKKTAPPPPALALQPLLYAAILLLAADFGIAIANAKNYFFFLPPKTLCRQIYSGNPFAESQEIADYIRNHGTPGRTIAVVGSEPQLYFLSRRISATGYIYTYPLMERQTFASKMQRDMAEDIERAKPEFLVFANLPFSWLGKPDSDQYIFKWFDDYKKKDYRMVGLVNLMPPNMPMWSYWDEQNVEFQPRSQMGCVEIYRRKK